MPHWMIVVLMLAGSAVAFPVLWVSAKLELREGFRRDDDV